MKTCSKCKVEHEMSEFHKDKSRTDGLHGACKIYILTKSRKYKESGRSRELELKRVYNISIKQYGSMLKEQNNKCKTCPTSNDSETLSVDHCHTTGKVRGLLCQNCNRALGMVKDNKTTLYNLIGYLENNNEYT